MAEFIKSGTEYDVELTKTDIPTQVKVGGITGKFVPNINISKWDSECWININHPDVVNTEKETFVDDKIELEIGNNIHRYYVDNLGHLEYEIVLKTKPISNKIELDLDFPEGLTFHYQDTLENEYNNGDWPEFKTLEEFLQRTHRPDNVVGSYAVYWKKKNNQYKTGKFCHIYRPKATDGNNDELWLNQTIVGKKLTIEIDQTWFDNAVYPMIISPNFGMEGIQTTPQVYPADFILMSGNDSPGSDGTVTSISVRSACTAATMDIKVGIYDDDGGPDNRIGTEKESANIGTYTQEWHQFPTNALSVLNGVSYWLGLILSSGTGFTIYHDSAGGTNRYTDSTHDYDTAWEATFSANSSSGALYSIFATYTETGGAALFASIADTVGITDTTATKVGNVRNISDNIGLTDILSKIGTYIRTLADNLANTDTINTARNLKKSITDDVGITDTIATKKFVLVTLADTIGITDILTKIGTYIRNIADNVSISDVLSTIGTFIRDIADSVGITDALASEKFVLVALTDQIGITDVLSKVGTFIRNIPDTVGITDILSKIGTYKRSITDTANITDTTTASKGVFRSIADSIGIIDVISAIVGKVAAIADTIGITDAITFIKTTVVGGRVFIAGIAKSLRISSKAKSLRISGEDKSLRISGESED